MSRASKPSTTKSKASAEEKWMNFISQPLGQKSLGSIPGLGSAFVDAFTAYNSKRVNQKVTKVRLYTI